MPLVIDIWGGEFSLDFETVTGALPYIQENLDAGYLVNIREEITWGPEENFDRIDETNH